MKAEKTKNPREKTEIQVPEKKVNLNFIDADKSITFKIRLKKMLCCH